MKKICDEKLAPSELYSYIICKLAAPDVVDM